MLLRGQGSLNVAKVNSCLRYENVNTHTRILQCICNRGTWTVVHSLKLSNVAKAIVFGVF